MESKVTGSSSQEPWTELPTGDDEDEPPSEMPPPFELQVVEPPSEIEVKEVESALQLWTAAAPPPPPRLTTPWWAGSTWFPWPGLQAKAGGLQPRPQHPTLGKEEGKGKGKIKGNGKDAPYGVPMTWPVSAVELHREHPWLHWFHRDRHWRAAPYS